MTLGQQRLLARPQLPHVQKRTLELAVSEVPTRADSPPYSAPTSVYVGRTVPGLVIVLPSMHSSFYQRSEHSVRPLERRRSAQAASALEPRSPVEKTIQETDHDTRKAQSPVEVQQSARKASWRRCCWAQPGRKGQS